MILKAKPTGRTIHSTRGHAQPAFPGVATFVVASLLLIASTGSASAQVPFGPQQVLPASPNLPNSIYAADFDGDGDVDLLSSSGDPSRIAWYENRLNEATADFGPQQMILSPARAPAHVFAQDLDGDGDVDVLSTSSIEDEIIWLENRLNEATADLGPKQVISTSADNAVWVLATDLDGDGDADVLSGSQGDGEVAWNENRLDEATADFGPDQVISIGLSQTSEVAAADLDGDGDADVVSIATFGTRLAWFENRLDEASADFSSERELAATATLVPVGLFVVDLDQDGDGDVLVGLSSSTSSVSDRVVWYENRLDEASADFSSEQWIANTVESATSVFAIDLDGDGDQDALTASYSADTVSWYENRLSEATADFGPEQVLSTAADQAQSLFAIDLDRDGDADVLSTSIGDDKIAWYENRLIHGTTNQFISWGQTEVSLPRRVAAGDVDRDGDVDLFLGRSTGLELYRNLGRVDFFEQSTISNNVFAQLEALDPADLDRDGDLDLLSAGTVFATGVFWYENATGDGSGTWPQTQITTTSANDVQAADLDNDGDLDAIFAAASANQVGWHENRLNEASADFGPARTISTAAASPRSIFAADLDRDGDLDVLSASASDDKIAWYENTGGGNFQPQQIVITTGADNARSVFAADIDGDGDLDVLSASQDDDKIAWYANDGTGVFSTPMTITTAADQVRSVWADDLDRDGDLDVVSASADGTAWYENTSGDGSTWEERIVTIAGSLDAITSDFDNDGVPDIAYLRLSPVGRPIISVSQGGQFSTAATNTAQRVVSNGQLEDVLAIEVIHLGRAGDTDVELTSLEILLRDTGGIPLASAQANALIDTLRLYRDDGSGGFEESNDFLVSTLSSFSLVNGHQTIPVVDDDPNAAVAFGGPAMFFITLEMTANAEEQPVAALTVTHLGGADAAEDASADLPLERDLKTASATARLDTELTDATCQAPFDLNLENRTIDATLTCEAGTELRFGSSTVTASGNLTLRAGSSVELDSAATMAGQLTLELDSSLLPP